MRSFGYILGRITRGLLAVILVVALGALTWGVVGSFLAVSAELQVALITAAATVMAATLAVVLSRSADRTREIEAHFREKKLAIYDEFLQYFFRLMHAPEADKEKEDKSGALVDFLREWQRKLILWAEPM